MNQDLILFKLAILSYFLAFLYGWASLPGRKKINGPIFYLLLSVGFLIHLAALYSSNLGHCIMLSKNVFGLAQVVIIMLILASFLILCVPSLRVFSLFIAALGAFLGLISFYLPQTFLPEIFNPNLWLEFHISLAITSYTFFGLAGVSSVMFLLQDFGLTYKKTQNIFRFLPALNKLEALSYAFLYIGVCLLGIATFLGFIIALDLDHTFSYLKLYLSLFILLSYSILLYLKYIEYLVGKSFTIFTFCLFFASFFSLWLFWTH